MLAVSVRLLSSSSSRSSSSILRLRSTIKATTTESTTNVGELSARERRQLRNERREMKAYDWKDEVEERLARRRKKKPQSSWMEKLNLDNLARLGPQWWVVRVSRLSRQEAAEQLARGIAWNFLNMDFKVYVLAVHIKKKLKSGAYSVIEKSLFPGCIFFQCILNKETPSSMGKGLVVVVVIVVYSTRNYTILLEKGMVSVDFLDLKLETGNHHFIFEGNQNGDGKA